MKNLPSELRDKVEKTENMEEKNSIEKHNRMLNDDQLELVSGGRKYSIPTEDTPIDTSGVFDPIPDVPKDIDLSMLHW